MNTITAASGIATSIGIFLVLVQLRMSQRQRYRQFEELYLQRYWQVIDDVGDFGLATSPVTLAAALPYLRLCEDQAEMRGAGWVTAGTWRVWADGIQRSLDAQGLTSAWQEAQKQLPESFSHLQRLAADPHWDPCSMHPVRSWARGLG